MNFRSTNLLRYAFVIIGAGALVGASAGASEITFELGGTTGVKAALSVPFNVLSGTALQGQTLSINFVFGTGRFGRLFSVTDSSLAAGLTLSTSLSGSPGFLGGTGFLFDQQGQQMIPLQSPQQLGSASNSNGVMFAGLFPLQAGGLNRPLDFFGIHFDLTLPDNPSVVLTSDSSFDLFFFDNNPSARFGVGPGIPQNIVPEGTPTLFLFSIGAVAVMFGRRYFAEAR